MNLVPMFSCQYKTIKNGYQLHECDKYGAKFYFFIFAIAMVTIGVIYNVALFIMMRKRKVSYREKDHDSFVKRKELEYVLGISDSWRKQSFFMFSSFKGSKLRMYFKPVYNLFILFLISVHAFLETDMKMKSNIFALAMTFGAIFIFAIRPFRCATTNFLIFFQFCHLCGPMYMVQQEISGLENGLLVNKYFSICLYVMFGIFGGCQFLVVVLSLTLKAKWPMNEKVLKSVVLRHETILEMMQNAYSIITKLRLKKVEAKKLHLEEIVEELTEEYNNAFADVHPFQYSVLELIDELKDTAVIIDDRKRKQEYHFLADFLEIIDDKKSYL
mmetsp:Transcript_12226/g.10837  ORF Transcript_12226/g.10837 Transcript_12226/m.10837 type:complete len:329 (+) Transcript_12226:690-1676(+)